MDLVYWLLLGWAEGWITDAAGGDLFLAGMGAVMALAVDALVLGLIGRGIYIWFNRGV